MSKLVFLIAPILINCVCCSNILWLSGVASPSHQLWSSVIQKALVLKGHNITALSLDVEKTKIKNLTYLHMNDVYSFYHNKSYNMKNMENSGSFSATDTLARYRADACIPAFQSEGFRKLLEYPRSFKFDLVVHDFVGAQCLLGFLSHFNNPPLVSASACVCPVAITSASGNPQYPNIVPANHLNHGFEMSFLRKFYNFLLYNYDNLVRWYYMYPIQNQIAKSRFEIDDVATLSRSSIVTLINLPPFDVMQPFYQTVIPVGGLHIQQPKKLEDDLLEFIEGSELGMVYFALGTNIKSENFSHRDIKHFLDAFAMLPSYRFLWKFDPSLMNHTLPKNVLVKKWMPQNDILAHPFTKVFIGHGGALSLQEAQWYGVPLLLIPFIIDQKQNAARSVERRIAIKLDHNDLSMDSIKRSLEELLEDKSYKSNMMEISASFQDQPQKPLDRAVFWIEYAIRHGNRTLLRSPGQDSTIFEYSYAIFTVCFAAIVQIFIFKFCFYRTK